MTSVAIVILIALAEQLGARPLLRHTFAVSVTVVGAPRRSEIASQSGVPLVTHAFEVWPSPTHPAVVTVRVTRVLFSAVVAPIPLATLAHRTLTHPVPVTRHITHGAGTQKHTATVLARIAERAVTFSAVTFAVTAALLGVPWTLPPFITEGSLPPRQTFADALETHALVTVKRWRTHGLGTRVTAPPVLTRTLPPQTQPLAVAVLRASLLILTGIPRIAHVTHTRPHTTHAVQGAVVGARDGCVTPGPPPPRLTLAPTTVTSAV